jgi:hypothetical protein
VEDRSNSGNDREREDEKSAEGLDPEEDDEADCSCSETEKDRRKKMIFWITLIATVLGGAASLTELISALSNHF